MISCESSLENEPEPKLPAQQALEREHAEARREQAWLELFGFPPPQWESESSAPPIDEEAIRRYARGESGEEEHNRVLELSLRFWSWARATARIYVDECLKRRE